MDRKHFLLGCLSVLIGCTGKPPVPQVFARDKTSPVEVGELLDLVTAAGLESLVLGSPGAFLNEPSLRRELDQIVLPEQFAWLEASSSIRVNEVRELLVARYERSTLVLLRGGSTPSKLVDHYKARWMHTKGKDEPGGIRWVRGVTAGGTLRSAVALGSVAGIESGGHLRMLAAKSYAQKRLTRVARARDLDDVKTLLVRFSDSPLVMIALAPFAPDWTSRRGIIDRSRALGLSVQVGSQGVLHGILSVISDWGLNVDSARLQLEKLWADLAESSVGRLLALHEAKASVSSRGESLELAIELDGPGLLRGLHGLVGGQLDDLMHEVE